MAAITAAPSSLAEKLVAVVGAGVAGLACASRLAEQGFPVTVFDSGRGPGGRMSQRRERASDGKLYYFDHGAQYFTVKDCAVQRLVDKWEADGIVAEWKGNFGSYDVRTGKFTADPDSFKKRYVGVPGMNAICHSLSQEPGIQARYSVTVTSFDWKEDKNTWVLTDKNGQDLGEFWAVVATDKNLASPRFFSQTGFPPPLVGAGIPTLVAKVAGVRSSPSFAVMLTFPTCLTSIPLDGFTVLGSKVLSWAARDSSKPGRNKLSEGDCWVLQSTSEYAQSVIDEAGLKKPSEELLSSVAKTLFMQFEHIGGIPSPSFTKAHRWGSAFPNVIIAEEEKCMFDISRRLAVCGDFCLGPKVESAILSGLATAKKIEEIVNTDAKL